jgi:hypothetical protein
MQRVPPTLTLPRKGGGDSTFFSLPRKGGGDSGSVCLILSLSKDEASQGLMVRQAHHEVRTFFTLPLEGGGRGGGEFAARCGFA